jgi:DNA-binding SARP family transcriptional activator
MQLRVLGSLEVVRDDVAVRLPSAQQRRLLTALLLTPGSVVPTDQLMVALWDDAPPPSALKSLRAHVSRLRAALEDDGEAIATHAAGYALRIEPQHIDAHRFERLVAEARALRTSDLAAALALLDEALGLWRGPAHADVADEAFARADAVRLEELRLSALEDRVDVQLAAGRHVEITAELEALARNHPLRERPHAQLMLALYRDGRQADALETYRRFRDTLADELGLEPSAALRVLERDVLRQDPRLAVAADAEPSTAGGVAVERPGTADADVGGGPPPLVERRAQLAALDGLLTEISTSGQGRLVIVRGEAGSGKTALIRRFCTERSDDARVLWGACDALFTPRPLGPIRDVAAGVDALAAVVGTGAQPFEVATALFTELRRISPSVLVLEDLHWGDEATLDVVRLLGRRVSTVPALVVASYRDDEVHLTHPLQRVLGELATARMTSELSLAPLSVGGVAQLAAPHDRDATQIHAVTGGNPLFVLEVLASPGGELPANVRQAVLGRASRLGRGARVVLDAVALVPPRIETWLLEAVTGADAAELDPCLGSGLITATSSGIAFRHELARRAVAEAVPAYRRVTLHRRVLDALSSLPEGGWDLASLAHHAEAAGDVDAVLRFADAAGHQAARVGAHREAASHYASVLRHADRLDPVVRAGVFERRARSCYLTDQNTAAIDAMEQAVRLHRHAGDRRAEGDALRQLSHFLWCPGRTREAMDRATRAVELLEQLPVGPELGMACSNVGQLAMNAEDVGRARWWSARAIDVAGAVGDVGIDIHARTNLATIAALAGDPDARRQFDDCAAAARAAGLDDHLTRILLNRAISAIRRHEYVDAAAALDRAEAVCGELGHELMLSYVRAYRSVVALEVGEWQRAEDLADLVLRYPRTSTVPRILASTVTALLAARAGSGDPAPALDLADDLAASTGELERLVPPALARAEVAWLTGRGGQIPELTDAVWRLATGRGATWMVGPLAAWRQRAGATDELRDGVAEPYVLQAAGRHVDAARWWSARGCRYATALSLLDADDATSVTRATRILRDLGAHAVLPGGRPSRPSAAPGR